MNNPYTENVKKGAAILDEKVPNWIDKINLEKLDMPTSSHCLLAQVASDDRQDFWAYFKGLKLIGMTAVDAASIFTLSGAFEFGSKEWSNNYAQLQQAWVDLISQRRQGNV